MEATQVLELIQTRRSVRKFTDKAVDDATIEAILAAGQWAPSGINNQPWRFTIVRDPAVKQRISELTKYGRIVNGAAVLLPVFMHKPSTYHFGKDHQSVGACLQSMLLMTHALGLGAVWLGEILKSAEEVRKVLDLPEDLELQAVVALGWPTESPAKNPGRKPLAELIVGRY